MTREPESAGRAGFEPATRAQSAIAMLVVVLMLSGLGWGIVTLPTGCSGAAAHQASTVERSTRVAAMSHDAVNTTREAFLAWDELHQQRLVDSATSLEDGQQMLAAYRDDRRVVEFAFEAAYGAVATLAALIPLVEANKATDAELILALSRVANAVDEVRDAVEKLMLVLP